MKNLLFVFALIISISFFACEGKEDLNQYIDEPIEETDPGLCDTLSPLELCEREVAHLNGVIVMCEATNEQLGDIGQYFYELSDSLQLRVNELEELLEDCY